MKYTITLRKEHVEKYIQEDRETRAGRSSKSICCRCPMFFAIKDVLPNVTSVGFTCATLDEKTYLDATKETLELMDKLTTFFTQNPYPYEALLEGWKDKTIELQTRDE